MYSLICNSLMLKKWENNMKVSFKKKVTGHICTIQWDRILVHQCICWECNTFEDDFLKQCRFHYVFYAPNSCLLVINKLLIFIFTTGKRNFLKLFQILFWNLKSSRAPYTNICSMYSAVFLWIPPFHERLL